MILRFLSVIIITVFTTLVIKPANAVTWTCYESSTSYWQMEQPEGYMPSWADCEAWRYGPPAEQNPEPDVTEPAPSAEPEPSASETPEQPLDEPSSEPTDEPSTPTEEPSSPEPDPQPTESESSEPQPPLEETPTPSPSPTEQAAQPPTQPSSSGQSQPDTPQTTESPTESPSPKPKPTQPTPTPEPIPQETAESLVEDVVNNQEESVEDFSFNTSNPSLEISSPQTPANPVPTLSTSYLLNNFQEILPQSVQEISEAVGQKIQALADSLPESVTNLGSDLSPENRKEAQQAVLVAVIVPQLAASVVRRIK